MGYLTQDTVTKRTQHTTDTALLAEQDGNPRTGLFTHRRIGRNLNYQAAFNTDWRETVPLFNSHNEDLKGMDWQYRTAGPREAFGGDTANPRRAAIRNPMFPDEYAIIEAQYAGGATIDRADGGTKLELPAPWPSCKLVWTPTPEGFQKEIIIANPDAAPDSFLFTVKTPVGCSYTPAARGGYNVMAPSGNVITRLAEPYVLDTPPGSDARPELRKSPLRFKATMTLGNASVAADGDKVQEVILSADWKEIAKWKPNLPLILDPTTTLDHSDIIDCTMQTGASSNDSTATQIRTGRITGTSGGVAATLIKMTNTAAIPNDITAVRIGLYTDQYSYDNSQAFDLRRLKRDWVETEATYDIYSTGNFWQTDFAEGANDHSTDNETQIDWVNDSTGAEEYAIDKVVWESWRDSTYSNYGFAFMYNDSGNQDRKYSSTEHATSSQRPYFEIDYTAAATSVPVMMHHYTKNTG